LTGSGEAVYFAARAALSTGRIDSTSNVVVIIDEVFFIEEVRRRRPRPANLNCSVLNKLCDVAFVNGFSHKRRPALAESYGAMA
jgi:hypothetical protein